MPRTKNSRSIAVVGAQSFLGRRTVAWLKESGLYQRIVVIDRRRPETLPTDTAFYKVDLTEPTADTMLLDIFRSESVDTVVHLGQLVRPLHADSLAHEYTVIGTFHLLNAVAAAGVRKVLVGSSTLVYGAHPLNPNYLAEGAPFRASKTYSFVSDQVEVESLLERFRKRHTDTTITVLRFAPILGPTVQNYITRYLEQPVTLTLLGFDPLLQVLHEADAVQAIQHGLEASYNGAVNIVPQDVLPLSTMLFRAGKFNAPVAHPVAYPMVSAAWIAGLSPVPAEHLDYIRYLSCGDGELASKVLGYEAGHRCDDTIASWSGIQRLRKVRSQEMGW